MIIWIDAQLSPSLAKWITDTLGISATAVRDLGLRDAKDFAIFQAGRKANAVVLTKMLISPIYWPNTVRRPRCSGLPVATHPVRTFVMSSDPHSGRRWTFSNPANHSWR